MGWLESWLGQVEGAMGLVPGPQLAEGIDDFKSPGGPVIGRAYATLSGVWRERWVAADPAAMRTAAVTEVVDSTMPADPAVDWLTDPRLAQGLGNSWVQDSDGFTYAAVPSTTTPVPADPVPTHEGYYLFNADATGNKTAVGALYRLYEVTSGKDTRWMDHWVLWSNYKSPQPGVTLRIERVNPSPWASLAALIADGQVNKPGATYAVVELAWK